MKKTMRYLKFTFLFNKLGFKGENTPDENLNISDFDENKAINTWHLVKSISKMSLTIMFNILPLWGYNTAQSPFETTNILKQNMYSKVEF